MSFVPRRFALFRNKGAVNPPVMTWQEWVNYFVHTSAEITSADYQSTGGSIANPDVDGPPGFETYNVVSICDDGTTFSNLYNPGSGNITVPPVSDLMMSWYMKRADGGAASVGTNSTTGSCYTRIFSGTSSADQVGEEAVGDGWYRGWCTVYGLTTGSMINTGLLRSSTQYTNDGGKLYVTCFQLEPVVPGVVDETTGPSPFKPTTDFTIGERARLQLGAGWTTSSPVTNYYVSKVQDWAYGAADVDAAPTKFFKNEHGQYIGLTRLNDQNDASSTFYDLFRNVATIPEAGSQLEWSIYFLPGNDDQLAIKIQNWSDGPTVTTYFTAATETWSTSSSLDDIGYETLSTVHGTVYRLWARFTIGSDVNGQVVHRLATGGSFTANGDHEIYLGGAQVVVLNSAADQLPPVVETTNTTLPNSKVFGSNVLYPYKGAIQPQLPGERRVELDRTRYAYLLRRLRRNLIN